MFGRDENMMDRELVVLWLPQVTNEEKWNKTQLWETLTYLWWLPQNQGVTKDIERGPLTWVGMWESRPVEGF